MSFTLPMKYCAKQSCEPNWVDAEDQYCITCGEELTPCLACRCGETINPRAVIQLLQQGKSRYCRTCGRQWDQAFLSQAMTVGLKRIVDNVAQKFNETIGAN